MRGPAAPKIAGLCFDRCRLESKAHEPQVATDDRIIYKAVIVRFGVTVQLGITTNPARGKCTTISPARSS
jgi:hypothetical protein